MFLAGMARKGELDDDDSEITERKVVETIVAIELLSWERHVAAIFGECHDDYVRHDLETIGTMLADIRIRSATTSGRSRSWSRDKCSVGASISQQNT